jgi:hypothetical protein
VADFPCGPPLASAFQFGGDAQRCSEPVRHSDPRGESPKERGEQFVRTSAGLPPRAVRLCGDSRHILERPRSN